MPNNRVNKAFAGYAILMILSAVDFKFHINEEIVIRSYIEKEFPFPVNFDGQMDIISNLKPDEWEPYFLKMMDDFYEDSSHKERYDLLQFAMDLIKADNVITKEENYFFNLLYNGWEEA